MKDITHTENNEGRHYYEQPIRVVKSNAFDTRRRIEINMMQQLMSDHKAKALEFAETLRRRENVFDIAEVST